MAIEPLLDGRQLQGHVALHDGLLQKYVGDGLPDALGDLIIVDLDNILDHQAHSWILRWHAVQLANVVVDVAYVHVDGLASDSCGEKVMTIDGLNATKSDVSLFTVQDRLNIGLAL
jgi:hypothetical protein